MKKRRKKKNTGGLILLILLFVLLAALLVLRILAGGSEAPQAEPVENESTEAVESTSVLAGVENTESIDTAVETTAPTPAPTLTPVQETAQPPVVLENEGELEIIIPDEMGQDGF